MIKIKRLAVIIIFLALWAVCVLASQQPSVIIVSSIIFLLPAILLTIRWMFYKDRKMRPVKDNGPIHKEVPESMVVNKHNIITPDIRYEVVFREDKMIFLKAGGQFDVNPGFHPGQLEVMGVLDEFIESRLEKREDKILKDATKKSDNDLVKMNKHNFLIDYKDISKIGIEKVILSPTPETARLVIIRHGGKKQKFSIPEPENIDVDRERIKYFLPDKYVELQK